MNTGLRSLIWSEVSQVGLDYWHYVKVKFTEVLISFSTGVEGFLSSSTDNLV